MCDAVIPTGPGHRTPVFLDAFCLGKKRNRHEKNESGKEVIADLVPLAAGSPLEQLFFASTQLLPCRRWYQVTRPKDRLSLKQTFRSPVRGKSNRMLLRKCALIGFRQTHSRRWALCLPVSGICRLLKFLIIKKKHALKINSAYFVFSPAFISAAPAKQVSVSKQHSSVGGLFDLGHLRAKLFASC